VEPSLLVIGLNHRTAPVALRERFWISENRRYEALQQLVKAEGIEEVAVLATCNRTEFLVWASDPALAANSVLHFLTVECGLRLREWEHFYRLLDEGALAHVFRVASGLDSLVLGEPEIQASLTSAWEQARTVAAVGPFLNAVLQKALEISERVNREAAIGNLAMSIPAAALEFCHHIFGSLAGKKVLLVGAGKINELAARAMIEAGAGPVWVIDKDNECAQELAEKLRGTAATLADRWQFMLQADIVISASGCPHVILTREEAERIARERNRVTLVILDIAMPRDVAPDVRRVDGIVLCDLDGLERVVKPKTSEHEAAVAEAEKIVRAEAQAFRDRLQTATVVPTIVALRRRLDEICRQELESFIQERGPFSRDEDQALHAITTQVIQKIATSLARELKDLPEKGEQEQMTLAVQRLFHLDTPSSALAGTSSKPGALANDPARDLVTTR
jgi:glutamyl-tRNA reductase